MLRRDSQVRKLTLGALLCALLLPIAADAAQKPKKPRKPKPGQGQQQEPQQGQGGQNQPQRPPEPPPAPVPPAAVGTVDRLLWQYKTGEARSAVQSVAGDAGQNPYVATALGRVLDQEKKYGEAEGQLRKAAELSPSDPAPWVYLGEALLRQRKTGDAQGAFRKAADLAQAKGGAEAAYFLGIAQYRLGNYDQAVSTLNGARAGNPALVPFHIGMARAFQENWQAAAEQFDRALELDSGLAYAYYYRGRAQERLGRKDRLINDMERFVALAPNAPEADSARSILRAVK